MSEAAASTTALVSIATLIGHGVLVVLGIVYCYELFTGVRTSLGRIVALTSVSVTFLVAAAGTVLTLVYSEVFGFVPCGLCWIQRIFLYPQVVIAGMMLFKKRAADGVDYLIALSSFGLVVALYQHYLQMGGTDIVGCPVVDVAADCAQRFVFAYGYITFPLMAGTVFAFIILALLFHRLHRLQ
jgi:disulfide bond formation protein DsbB